jgi:hypothetical protein
VERAGGSNRRSNGPAVPLIDNIAASLEGWIEAGRGGYVFRSDSQFIHDVEAGLVRGFEAADV